MLIITKQNYLGQSKTWASRSRFISMELHSRYQLTTGHWELTLTLTGRQTGLAELGTCVMDCVIQRTLSTRGFTGMKWEATARWEITSDPGIWDFLTVQETDWQQFKWILNPNFAH